MVFAVAALLGVLLCAPSLGAGLMLDDYGHRLFFTAPQYLAAPQGPMGAWDLFRFMSGTPANIEHHRELGIVPWWTAPGLRLAFFRPISSLTHWLDYQLWPDSPWVMHAESLLCWGALALLVGYAYRRFLGPTAAAGLAALLYSVDDARSFTVTWIANRNALLAGVFGVAALLVHDRWRRAGWKPGALVAPALFSLSLLSGEAALGIAAYLFAHAVCFEWGGLAPRLRALAPYLLIGVLWAAFYTSYRYGAQQSGAYFDPLADPVGYLLLLPERFSLLLAGQVAYPPPDLWMMLLPGAGWLAALICGALVLLVGGTLWRALPRQRVQAFFALGMLLSLFPVAATFPSDRLLLMSGLGAFGLLGSFLSAWLDGALTSRGLRVMAGVLFFLHAVLAPLTLPLRCRSIAQMLHDTVERAGYSLPSPETLEGKTLVMLNAPDPLIALDAFAVTAGPGVPMPHSIRLLSVCVEGSLRVFRPSPNVLQVTLSRGFLRDFFSQVFRDPRLAFSTGEAAKLSNVTVEILSLHPDGLPETVAFTFGVPLEDASLVFVNWDKDRFAPYKPPAVGETQELSAIDYGAAVLPD
jgi:hypothetical protein